MSHLWLSLVLTLIFCASGRQGLAQKILPLWPEATGGGPTESDTTTDKDNLVAGKRVQRLTNVSRPTIAVYPAPKTNGSGAAVVVFPGGGYRILAYDLEGTEVCAWLNAAGIMCVLLKYRVPGAGPYPEHSEDLADAQRAVRMTRQHAAEWSIDPKRVGVLGFSAGGHLAAVLSCHASEKVYQSKDSADELSAQPNFAILIYPGGLVHPPDVSTLGPEVTANTQSPPTFLIQAEDDSVHVENTIVYYASLKQAKIPSEMHIFAQGGHGYGLRKTRMPVTAWPHLAVEWLHTIGVLT